MKNVNLSTRALTTQPSHIRRLIHYKEDALKRGLTVYCVHLGNPDLEIPDFLQESIVQVSTKMNVIPYSNSQGTKELITAWQQFYAQIGIEVNTTNILATNGASEALLIAGMLLFDPGDKYIVFEPFYGIYKPLKHLVSAEPIGVLLDKANDYHLPSRNEIINKITQGVKAIVINNPNNPTGTIFTASEIRLIIDIAMEFGLFIICDETYRGITFEDKKSISILEIATTLEQERVVVIDSMSKRLSACGMRMGVLISNNKELMRCALNIAETRVSAPFLEQQILAKAMKKAHDYLPYLTSVYQKRRDVFINTLQGLLHIEIKKPDATIYAMVSLPIKDTTSFAKWLLTDFSNNNETVLIAPGDGFYITPNQGKNEIRVALVLEDEKLKRVAKLLAIAVKQYNSAF